MKTNYILTMTVASSLLMVACNKEDSAFKEATTIPSTQYVKKDNAAGQPNTAGETPASSDAATTADSPASTNPQATTATAEKPAAAPTEAQKNETPKLDSAGLLERIQDTNEAEIKMGKLAELKGSSKYVKDYAKMLQKDHKAAEQKVSALAKKKSIKLGTPTLTDVESAKKKDHQELMAKLKNLKGKEFDKAFIEGMKTGHEDAIHLLETANVDDQDVKKLVEDILPTIRKHYRTSVDIVQDLAL